MLGTVLSFYGLRELFSLRGRSFSPFIFSSYLTPSLYPTRASRSAYFPFQLVLFISFLSSFQLFYLPRVAVVRLLWHLSGWISPFYRSLRPRHSALISETYTLRKKLYSRKKEERTKKCTSESPRRGRQIRGRLKIIQGSPFTSIRFTHGDVPGVYILLLCYCNIPGGIATLENEEMCRARVTAMSVWLRSRHPFSFTFFLLKFYTPGS